MPKPDANRKKAKTRPSKTKKPSKGGTAPSKLSAAELFQRAQMALAFDRFETAKDLLR